MTEPHTDVERNSARATPVSEEEDGVDVSLIRWVLSLTVSERLALLQRQADSLTRLRNAASER